MKAMNGTEPHRTFLSFCFLETGGGGETVADIYFSSRQASRKSKDHEIFRCHKSPFSANSWRHGFSIIFRGYHRSQQRKAMPTSSESEIWTASFQEQQNTYHTASTEKTRTSQPPGELREPESYSFASSLSALVQA